MPENDKYIEQAKFAVMVELRDPLYKESFITTDDLDIVWFVKALQNWKALIRIAKLRGFYAEVTFDGDKGEAYVDVYRKLHNRIVKIPQTMLDFKEF